MEYLFNLFKRSDPKEAKKSPLLLFETEVPRFSTFDVQSGRIRKGSFLRGRVSNDTSLKIGNSCSGLILISYDFDDVLFDPLLNKIVAETRQPDWGGSALGFFYHPRAKEFRLLYAHEIREQCYEYHIYEFGSHKWRTALSPTSEVLPFIGGRCAYRRTPTVTAQAMYWCQFPVIAVFDLNTEEFSLQERPKCDDDHGFYEPRLTTRGGTDLCCCYVRSGGEMLVDVWCLQDYAKWSWEKKYAVKNDLVEGSYPSEAWRAHISWMTRKVDVICILGNELVLSFSGVELRCYSLECDGVFREVYKSKCYAESVGNFCRCFLV